MTLIASMNLVIFYLGKLRVHIGHLGSRYDRVVSSLITHLISFSYITKIFSGYFVDGLTNQLNFLIRYSFTFSRAIPHLDVSE